MTPQELGSRRPRSKYGISMRIICDHINLSRYAIVQSLENITLRILESTETSGLFKLMNYKEGISNSTRIPSETRSI